MNLEINYGVIIGGIAVVLITSDIIWIHASILKNSLKTRKLHRDIDYLWAKMRDYHPEEAKGLREETHGPYHIFKRPAHKARESGAEKSLIDKVPIDGFGDDEGLF